MTLTVNVTVAGMRRKRTPAVTIPTFTAPAPLGGSLDDTPQLLAFINAVPNRATITFPAGAVYTMGASFRFGDRHEWTFEGNGARFEWPYQYPFPGGRERRHFWFERCTGLTIRDLTVQGSQPPGYGGEVYSAQMEAQHAFDLSGADILVEDCSANDVWGDFIYVNAATRVVFRNNTFARNGRQGAGVTGGEDILIQNNSFDAIRRSLLDVEPNTVNAFVRRVTFDSNTVGYHRLNFFASKGAGSICEDIVISNNVLGPTARLTAECVAPAGTRRGPITFHNNRGGMSFGSPINGNITITGYDDVRITDNDIKCQVGRPSVAIYLQSCTVDLISGNNVTGDPGDEIPVILG